MLSLLLIACGGGGSGEAPGANPVAAQARDLVWVDVQSSQGRSVMRHRYAPGSSADEDVVTTTQYAGYDWSWGTADDWRTAVTRCRYQGAGTASSVSFSPDSFFSVSAAACTWRRPADTVQVHIDGMYVPPSSLSNLYPGLDTGTSVGVITELGLQPYLNVGDLITVLKIFNDGVAVESTSTISADATSLSVCQDDCQPLETRASLPISCGSLCGVTLTSPVAAGLPISLNSCGYSTADIYELVRAQAISSGGRVDKVVYSPALTQPFCYVTGYDQYRYDSQGRFTGTESYNDRGSDGIWMTADDKLNGIVSVQTLSDGREQVYYSGPGADGVWKTADDKKSGTLKVQLHDDGRLRKVTQCRSRLSTDSPLVTDAALCQMLVFHYADEH